MPEWFMNLLLAIGGGSVVLVGILTIFKTAFMKLFEVCVESSFEKSLEKYKNKLTRSTRAYEILLEREMKFYERVDVLYAEIIVNVQDLVFYLQPSEGDNKKFFCEKMKDTYLRYLELIKALKNEILVHQSYIPQNIFETSSNVTKIMQSSIEIWTTNCKLLFEGDYNDIDIEKADEQSELVLFSISVSELEIKNRLKYLSL